jgi:UDP-GlcNAc:undecaprenyl-phosphate/decaprenyl-phosphate GlcNAc-1-phosphate transferase
LKPVQDQLDPGTTTLLVEGSDGLAAGVAGIAAFAFAFPPLQVGGAGRVFALSVAGACAGFVVYNFPTGLIFLGDSGSTLLGLAIAALTVDLYRSSSMSLSITLFPLFVAALPLLDAALAAVRRVCHGRSPYTAADATFTT